MMQEAPVVCAALFVVATIFAAPCLAQNDQQTDPDEARIQDIITASHILTNEGVLDSFGHISARSVKNPELVGKTMFYELDRRYGSTR